MANGKNHIWGYVWNAGKLLGVNERSVRRWVEGSRPVPPFAARFLRYLIATKKSGEKAIAILDRLGDRSS